MPRNQNSLLWDYFTKSEDGDKANCNKCPTPLSLSGGGSTSSLRKHLKAKHKMLYTEYEASLKALEEKSY